MGQGRRPALRLSERAAVKQRQAETFERKELFTELLNSAQKEVCKFYTSQSLLFPTLLRELRVSYVAEG